MSDKIFTGYQTHHFGAKVRRFGDAAILCGCETWSLTLRENAD
jgi:hypothetical protein